MLSINGIYDGEKILPITTITDNRKYKVIITFVEELDNKVGEEIALRNFGTSKAATDFWTDPSEDIYQNFLPKE